MFLTFLSESIGGIDEKVLKGLRATEIGPAKILASLFFKGELNHIFKTLKEMELVVVVAMTEDVVLPVEAAPTA